MSKAILVIDMPESCAKCPFFEDHYNDMCCSASQNRTINYPYPKDFRQEWCPLRVPPAEELIWFEDAGSDYERGFNACLDEILGG